MPLSLSSFGRTPNAELGSPGLQMCNRGVLCTERSLVFALETVNSHLARPAKGELKNGSVSVPLPVIAAKPSSQRKVY